MSKIHTYTIRQESNYFLAFKLFLLLLVLFNHSYFTAAQEQLSESSFKPNLQLGISAGPSTFFGDIKQNEVIPSSSYMNEWRFAYGLNFSYNISYVFSIRVQGLYGKLSGTNQAGKIWFENDYYELNFNTAINFNNLFGKKRDNRLANIFGVVGFGIMNYNTVVKRLGENFVYKRVGYGYGTGIDGRQRQEFFMVGAGVDFRVSKRLNILFETVNKLPGSDELDGVESGKYYDLYNYTSIGLTYRFAFLKKTKKPKALKTVYQPIAINGLKPKNIAFFLAIQPDLSIIYAVIQPHVDVQIEHAKVQIEEETEVVKPSLIEYRVQIRAEYAKPLAKTWLSGKYRIPISEIKENFVNGYYVYSLGSFLTYKNATIKSNELQSKNGIQDAFVVAYKDGERVFPIRK